MGIDYDSLVCFSLLDPESEVSAVVAGVFLLNYSKLTKSDSDIRESSRGILEIPFMTSFSLVAYSPKYFCLYKILVIHCSLTYYTEDRYILFMNGEIEYLNGLHNSFEAIDRI